MRIIVRKSTQTLTRICDWRLDWLKSCSFRTCLICILFSFWEERTRKKCEFHFIQLNRFLRIIWLIDYFDLGKSFSETYSSHVSFWLAHHCLKKRIGMNAFGFCSYVHCTGIEMKCFFVYVSFHFVRRNQKLPIFQMNSFHLAKSQFLLNLLHTKLPNLTKLHNPVELIMKKYLWTKLHAVRIALCIIAKHSNNIAVCARVRSAFVP